MTKELSALTKNASPAIISDITYKTVDQKKMKLDIYQPLFSQNKRVPVVVYIHGGGWASGDKSEIHNDYRKVLLHALLTEGYAVISIDYRLTNRNGIHFPAPVLDCKDAIRWVYKNADAYHFDTEKIGLWGTSAGAHLAMLMAYSTDTDFYGAAELKKYSSKVKYVLNNYGPVDLEALFRPGVSNFKLWLLKFYDKKRYNTRQSRLATFTGLDIRAQREEISNFVSLYSPVKYINRQTVPTFTLHGDTDKTVSLEQADILEKVLTKNGVPHELIVYQGEGHGLKSLNKVQIDELTIRSLQFIKGALDK